MLKKISSFGGKTGNFTTWEKFLKEKTIYEGPKINLNTYFVTRTIALCDHKINCPNEWKSKFRNWYKYAKDQKVTSVLRNPLKNRFFFGKYCSALACSSLRSRNFFNQTSSVTKCKAVWHRSAGFFWISWQQKSALFQYMIKSGYVFGKKERSMDSMSSPFWT